MGLLIIAPAQAQTEDDFRVWSNVTAITNLDALHPRLERFYSWLEGQGRFRDGVDALDQGLLRGGLGYGLTENTTLWPGRKRRQSDSWRRGKKRRYDRRQIFTVDSLIPVLIRDGYPDSASLHPNYIHEYR